METYWIKVSVSVFDATIAATPENYADIKNRRRE